MSQINPPGINSRCETCNKSFKDRQALQQHLDDAPVHNSALYECELCTKEFKSEEALQQHRNSPAHPPVFKCDLCNKAFNREGALQQHHASPAHALVFKCEKCDYRTFSNRETLQQHLNSGMHPPIIKFKYGYDQSFKDKQPLQQRLNSPVHLPRYSKDDRLSRYHTINFVPESSRTSSLLRNKAPPRQTLPHIPVIHKRASASTVPRFHNSSPFVLLGRSIVSLPHNKPPASSNTRNESPLDKFFYSFSPFNYDPSLPPATSFELLQKNKRWYRGHPASAEGWNRYQNALAEEFQGFFWI